MRLQGQRVKKTIETENTLLLILSEGHSLSIQFRASRLPYFSSAVRNGLLQNTHTHIEKQNSTHVLPIATHKSQSQSVKPSERERQNKVISHFSFFCSVYSGMTNCTCKLGMKRDSRGVIVSSVCLRLNCGGSCAAFNANLNPTISCSLMIWSPILAPGVSDLCVWQWGELISIPHQAVRRNCHRGGRYDFVWRWLLLLLLNQVKAPRTELFWVQLRAGTFSFVKLN